MVSRAPCYVPNALHKLFESPVGRKNMEREVLASQCYGLRNWGLPWGYLLKIRKLATGKKSIPPPKITAMVLSFREVMSPGFKHLRTYYLNWPNEICHLYFLTQRKWQWNLVCSELGSMAWECRWSPWSRKQRETGGWAQGLTIATWAGEHCSMSEGLLETPLIENTKQPSSNTLLQFEMHWLHHQPALGASSQQPPRTAQLSLI